MRIDIGLSRTTDGRTAEVRDGPGRAGPGGARWAANWHFADPLIGHCTRKLHYGAPSNVIQKNERNKGRERLSAARAPLIQRHARRKGGRKGWREVWWWWWQRLTVYRISATPFFNLAHHTSLLSNGLVADRSSVLRLFFFFLANST